MYYQELINIKANILAQLIKESNLLVDSQDQMPLQSSHKNKHYYGLTEDTFYMHRHSYFKDGN